MAASTTIPKRLLTAAEASVYLGLSVRTIRALRAQHELPTLDFGHRSLRFDVADLNAFIARRRQLGSRTEQAAVAE